MYLVCIKQYSKTKRDVNIFLGFGGMASLTGRSAERGYQYNKGLDVYDQYKLFVKTSALPRLFVIFFGRKPLDLQRQIITSSL